MGRHRRGAAGLLKQVGITDEPQITLSDPYDRADQNDRKWLHFRVTIGRRCWPGEIREAQRCLIEMTCEPVDGREPVTVQGMWATNTPPYMAEEANLRENDPHHRFSVVLRSSTRIRPTIQPKADVDADVTYVTGVGFLAHGYTTHRLTPGEYTLQVRLYSGSKTWSATRWKLKNPNKGIAGLETQRS